MAFGLIGKIIYVSLLLINAIAVLSEERFLARIGWSTAGVQQAQFQQFSADPSGFGGAQEGPGVKARMINLISAVRTVMRIPLIPANIIVIAYELVLG